MSARFEQTLPKECFTRGEPLGIAIDQCLDMKEFVQEIIEKEGPLRIIGCFTGWEAIVFEVEDDPSQGVGFFSALSTAAIAP